MKKNIVIIILSVLVIGLGGYLVFDKLIANDKAETTNDVISNNETNQSNLNDEMAVKQLLKSVSIGYCGGGYRYEINKGDVLKYNDLTDEERFSLAYINWFPDTHERSIKKSTMLEAYNKFFGDGEYTLPEIGSVISRFQRYQLVDDTYVAMDGAGGCGPQTEKYVLDAFNVSDSKISFDVVLVVVEYDTTGEDKTYIMEPGSVNYDRIQANEIYERRIEVSGKDITDEKILDTIASTKSNFPQFRFTFNAQNDRYIFESVERIN